MSESKVKRAFSGNGEQKEREPMSLFEELTDVALSDTEEGQIASSKSHQERKPKSLFEELTSYEDQAFEEDQTVPSINNQVFSNAGGQQERKPKSLFEELTSYEDENLKEGQIVSSESHKEFADNDGGHSGGISAGVIDSVNNSQRGNHSKPLNHIMYGPEKYRPPNAPILFGQPVEGRAVYWQLDSSSTHCLCRQEFSAQFSIYWDLLAETIEYFSKNENGELVKISEADYGRSDQLRTWIPRYKQLPFVDILLSSEFPSIPPQVKLCLITLVSRADGDGMIRDITYFELARLTSYSIDTVIKHLKILSKSRLIKEIGKKRSPSKKRGQWQEKQARQFKVILGYEKAELDGVFFHHLRERLFDI